MTDTPLRTTPPLSLHLELGAKRLGFAGCATPVSRTGDILAEHRHSRQSALLFDDSLVGEIRRVGNAAARALESLVPVAMASLAADPALPNHEVDAELRGRRRAMRVAPMPFIPHRQFRG